MKIYVVTSGCYSDYGIEKVFLTYEKAALFAANCYESAIEEYETEDDNINGDISKIKCLYRFVQAHDLFRYIDDVTEFDHYKIIKKNDYNPDNRFIEVLLDKPDEDLAYKIARDKYFQQKAERNIL